MVAKLLLAMVRPRLVPRRRDFSLVSPPRPGGGKCLFSYGINQAEVVKSLTYDVNRLEATPDRVIAEAIAGEFARGIILASIFAKRGKSYKEIETCLRLSRK
ncbi:hypothetical protein Pfo_009131 [Paulownia fortunei]|nr:hypothetical protein Pfo_009131 [Paulownia fortunei]